MGNRGQKENERSNWLVTLTVVLITISFIIFGTIEPLMQIRFGNQVHRIAKDELKSEGIEEANLSELTNNFREIFNVNKVVTEDRQDSTLINLEGSLKSLQTSIIEWEHAEKKKIQQDHIIRKARDKIKKEVPAYIILALIFLGMLVLVKGWSKISKSFQILPEQTVNKYDLQQSYPTISWFLGASTLSYGFLKWRIVLGPDFLTAPSNHKKFILSHEISHLIYRDSIVKNLLINFKKLFLLFFLIITISSLSNKFELLASLALPDGLHMIMMSFPNRELTQDEIDKLNMFNGYVILSNFKSFFAIAVLFWAIGKFTNWFSRTKEYLADGNAFFSGNIDHPRLGKNEDRFHPSEKMRIEYLAGKPIKESILPLFLVVFLFLTLGGSGPITNPIFQFGLVAILLIFCIYDIIIARLQYLSFKHWAILFSTTVFFLFFEFELFGALFSLGENPIKQLQLHSQAMVCYMLFIVVITIYRAIKFLQHKNNNG